MSYATVQDMIARFGQTELAQLTDHDNIPPSVVDNDHVQIALDDACALVDGYVGVVYRLPLRGCAKPLVPGQAQEFVPPPQVVRWTCDVARFYLYDDLAPENEVYRRFKEAQVAMQKLADGKTALACPWGGEPGDVLSATPQTEADLCYSFSARSVTDDDLRGF